MSIIIRDKDSETVLAEGQEMGRDVISYEGNLYFDSGSIVDGVLQVTEKTGGVWRWLPVFVTYDPRE